MTGLRFLTKQLNRRYLNKASFGVAFICNVVLDLYLISILQEIIDAATKMRMDEFFLSFRTFIIVLFIDIAIIIADQYFLRKLSNYGNMDLQKYTYRHLLEKKFPGHKNVGELISGINNDVPIISSWVSTGTTISIAQFVILISCVALLFYYSVEIAAFIIVVTVAAFLFSRHIGIKNSYAVEKYQEQIGTMNSLSYESLQNISTIIQLGKQEYFLDKIKSMKETYNDASRSTSKYCALENSVLGFLADVLPVFTLIIAILLGGSGKISVGVAFAIMLITQKLNEPVIVLAELLIDKKSAEQLYKGLKDVYEKPIDKNKKTIEPDTFQRLNIDLENFTFPEKQESLLRNVSISVDRGSLVVVKGESGVGKTTLINLISGLISMEGVTGSILYNGKDIGRMKLSEYYKHVLQVQQDTVLIEGTLEENLFLGDGFSKPEIDEVIYTCRLEEFVKEKGIRYYIRENEGNISGGERQRIGLARILLRRPELLILDEITGALNEELRKDIVHRLLEYKEKHDTTIFAISHNDDFDEYCDFVYTL